MQITERQLIAGSGCTAANAKKWLEPINKALTHWGIQSKRAISAFVANIAVESGRFASTVESLNYSAERMAVVWPSRFAERVGTTKTYRRDAGGQLIPNAAAKALARRPEALANNVYADRNGNGPESSGDGWAFRGRGLIQLTGRLNYGMYMLAAGVNVIDRPDTLSTPEYAADSAGWYFMNSGCIGLADSGDGNFAKIVKAINGALPGPGNEGELRTKLYEAMLLTF